MPIAFHNRFIAILLPSASCSSSFFPVPQASPSPLQEYELVAFRESVAEGRREADPHTGIYNRRHRQNATRRQWHHLPQKKSLPPVLPRDHHLGHLAVHVVLAVRQEPPVDRVVLQLHGGRVALRLMEELDRDAERHDARAK